MDRYFLKWRYRKGFQRPGHVLQEPSGHNFPRSCDGLEQLRAGVLEIVQWSRDNRFSPICVEVSYLAYPMGRQRFQVWQSPMLLVQQLDHVIQPDLWEVAR